MLQLQSFGLLTKGFQTLRKANTIKQAWQDSKAWLFSLCLSLCLSLSLSSISTPIYFLDQVLVRSSSWSGIPVCWDYDGCVPQCSLPACFILSFPPSFHIIFVHIYETYHNNFICYAVYSHQIRVTGISKSSNIFKLMCWKTLDSLFSSNFEMYCFVVKYRH